MADRNFFRTTDGSIALPVSSDGEFFTNLINTEEGSLCEIYVEFYSDELLQNPVTPTGGTIDALGSPLGGIYLTTEGDQTISAPLVSVPNATYTPIVLDGLIERAKIIVSGITGALYMKAVLFNHD